MPVAELTDEVPVAELHDKPPVAELSDSPPNTRNLQMVDPRKALPRPTSTGAPDMAVPAIQKAAQWIEEQTIDPLAATADRLGFNAPPPLPKGQTVLGVTDVGNPIMQGVDEFVTGLYRSLTPANAAQIATMMVAPETAVAKTIGAKFTAQMAADAPEHAAEFGKALGNKDAKGATAALLNYAVSAAPAAHVAAKAIPEAMKSVAEGAQVMPQTAAAVVDQIVKKPDQEAKSDEAAPAPPAPTKEAELTSEPPAPAPDKSKSIRDQLYAEAAEARAKSEKEWPPILDSLRKETGLSDNVLETLGVPATGATHPSEYSNIVEKVMRNAPGGLLNKLYDKYAPQGQTGRFFWSLTEGQPSLSFEPDEPGKKPDVVAARKALIDANKVIGFFSKGTRELPDFFGKSGPPAPAKPAEVPPSGQAVEKLSPKDEFKQMVAQRQKDVGWNSKWPFIPADFGNQTFRDAIESDPTLTPAEKDKMFDAAGKLLGFEIERKSSSPPTGQAVAPGEAPIGIGPGAKSAGEPPYSAMQQLIDQLKVNPPKATSQGITAATKMADAWASTKASGARGLARLQAIGEALKQAGTGLRNVTDLDRRLGELDYALQKSVGENVIAKRLLKEQVPDKTLREATAIWIDAGGDEAKIRDALANLPAKTKPNVRRALELASTLPEEGKTFAQMQAEFFGRRLQDAQGAGVLDQGLEDYFTHIWKKEADMPDSLRAALSNGQVNTYFQYARQRKISTLLEGILAGKTPELDPADVLPFYSHTMDRAIASRQFVKDLATVKGSDGRPAVVARGMMPAADKSEGPRLIKPLALGAKWAKDPETGERKMVEEYKDYERINHPALRRWKWIGEDADGKPIMMEGELAIHPQFYERLRRIMDRGALTPTPLMRGALRLSTEVKGLKLGLPSLFHLMHVGTHGLYHWVSPFDEMKPIEWDSAETKYAIEKGHLKIAPSPHELSQFSEGEMGGGTLIQKIPGLGPWSKAASEWLFGSYIPRLKMNTFRVALKRNMEHYAKDIAAGKVTREQIADRVGDAVNNAYGELNHMFLGKEGRHPGFQRFLRMTFLAPDFGEARGRFVAKAFTKFGHEERLALATAAATLYTIARVGNYLSTGDPQAKDLKHAFQIKIGDKWWGIRSVIGDLDRAITESGEFIGARLNPITTKPIMEFISGRDWRGVKRDGIDQMKDLASAVVPIQAGGLARDDQTALQGFVAAMGFQSKKETPEGYIQIKAREWQKAHPKPIGSPMEEIYDPEKDATRKLKMALEDGNEVAARDEYQKLTRTIPAATLKKSIHSHLTRPFAGSKAADNEFVKTLSKQEKNVYNEARVRQTKQLDLFNRVSK